MVPDIKRLHIELTNLCTLKCPACARTEFIESQIGKYWKNYNLDYTALDSFLDIDLNGITFLLCGNYGDPLYYPKLIPFIKHFKQKGVTFEIATNGSYKTKEWWQELCSLLDENDKVTFAIDGTPDNFTTYRINGDWKSIKDGIDVCVSNSVNTEWKYLVFNYNEEYIDQAKQIATTLGIKSFTVAQSSRFHNDQVAFIPSNSFVQHRYQTQKQVLDNCTVSVEPKCDNGLQHFITAEGYYTPCCYSAVHYFYYKTVFGKQRKKLFDIASTTISSVLEVNETVDFYSSLDTQAVCQFNCPSKST